MKMGSIEAYLQELKVKYGDTYQDIQPASYDENGNPTSFSFELPNTDEYILVKMNPHVAMMGNTDLDARIKVDYDGLKVASNDNSNSDQKENEDNNKDQTKDSTTTTDPSTTNISSSNNETSPTKTSAVDTGDYNSAYVMMALAGLSVTGAYALVKTKKED